MWVQIPHRLFGNCEWCYYFVFYNWLPMAKKHWWQKSKPTTHTSPKGHYHTKTSTPYNPIFTDSQSILNMSCLLLIMFILLFFMSCLLPAAVKRHLMEATPPSSNTLLMLICSALVLLMVMTHFHHLHYCADPLQLLLVIFITSLFHKHKKLIPEKNSSKQPIKTILKSMQN